MRRLTELRSELLITETKQDEKMTALQDADRVIAQRRRHIDAISKQVRACDVMSSMHYVNTSAVVLECVLLVYAVI